MSGALTDTSILAGAAGAGEAYTIDQSVRFDDGDSAYLSRTPSSAGNQKTFTLSFWTKRCSFDTGDDQMYLAGGLSGQPRFMIGFGTLSPAKFRVGFNPDGSGWNTLDTTAMYRDPGAWLHIVVAVDTTQATASNRTKLYINGEQVTAFDNESYVDQDVDLPVNSIIEHRIGANAYSDYMYLNSYLAEYYFIDGQALTPSSFGETNVLTNQWVPKEVVGMTFGTNGFYLKFDNSTGGSSFTDSSSSAHTITPEGPSAGSPAVWNSPAQKKIGNSSIKFSGGYLRVADSAQWALANDWTFEAWVYCTQDPASGGGLNTYLWGQYDSDPSNAGCIIISYGTSGRADFSINNYAGYFRADNIGLTQNNWHHVAFCKSVATGTNYVFVDGNSKSVSVSGTPGPIGNYSTAPCIGAGDHSGSPGAYLFQGYMDEFRISGSARYTAAFTPQTTPFVNDADTKLLIHSNFDGTGLGTDSSGNGNNFGPINLTATDQMSDTPSNNWCTMNPIVRPRDNTGAANYSTFKEGNLELYRASANYAQFPGTIAIPNSGKWYWEFNRVIASGTGWYGVGAGGDWSGPKPGGTAGFYASLGGDILYYDDAKKDIDGTLTTYGATWYGTGIMSLALNLDDNEITFYKDNVSQGTITITGGLLTAAFIVPIHVQYGTDTVVYNFGQDSSFAGNSTAQGNTDANGIGDFYYAVPAGHLAVCNSNLSDPSIALPSDHFNTVLYTGDGTVSRAITGVGFTPDMAVAKARNTTGQFMTVDSVRGMGTAQMKRLVWNANYASQDATTNEWTSLDSDGFTFSNTAGSGYSDLNIDTTTYVTWSWLAGGSAVTNNDGSLETKVSANTTAGFSIVLMNEDGTSSTQTLGHGLAQAPELVIGKPVNAADHWRVGSDDLTSWSYIAKLDTTAAESDVGATGAYAATAPTGSVVTVGEDGLNNSGRRSVLYCFHSVEGYSKVGSYTGNGNADGTFVYTGFRPAYVLCRRYSAVSGWHIFDDKRDGDYNVIDVRLEADNTDAENSSNSPYLDLV